MVYLTRWWGVSLTFLGVILLWLLAPYLPSIWGWAMGQMGLESPSSAGEFGDQFGSVTALFSGLAFAGLLLTLALQRNELHQTQEAVHLQTKELELTREAVKAQTEELKLSGEALQAQVTEQKQQRQEMEGMKKAQELQVEFMSLQGFENSFFQLLKMWNEHVDGITIGTNLGKDALSRIARQVTSAKEEFKPHQDFYMAVFDQQHQHKLGPYFAQLLHILLHIKKSSLTDEEKKRYGQIVRANLSDDEKKLLLCNCSFPIGGALKPLAEEFGLLRGLSEEYLAQVGYLQKNFSKNAFV